MFSRLSRKRIVVLLVLTCLLLITLDRRGNPVIDKVRVGFSEAVRPFDTAAEAISKPIARAWNGITNYDDLQAENERLRDQLDQQKGLAAVYELAILENAQLKQLNNLPSLKDYEHVTGRVVGEAPSNVQTTIEIDIGSRSGVKAGMPVVNSAGLVGRVTIAYAQTSVVLLITDPRYALKAQVLSSNVDVQPDPATTTTSGQSTTSGPSTSTSSTTTTTTLPDAVPVNPGPGDTPPPTSSSSTTTTTIVPMVLRETGTIIGQGADNPLLLRFVDDMGALQGPEVGSLISTAGGTDELAPPGIPIGVISAKKRQQGSSIPVIEITPNADLRQLNFVSVVLYEPNQTVGG